MPQPRKTRGRRLSADIIVAGAIQVIERVGFEGLTLRLLAAELGTDPSAVYRHFRDKDEVHGAVLERLLAELELPSPTGQWRVDLREMCVRLHRLIRLRPGLAPVFVRQPPATPAVVAFTARAAELLEGAEIPDREKTMAALRALFALVIGWGLLDVEGVDGQADPHADALLAAYRALPADAGAQAAQIVGAVVWDTSSPELFDVALDMLLDGIAGAA